MSKMSAYRRDCYRTKYMYFLIKDNKLLEKCNKIQDKVSSIKKGFDNEPIYIEKYLKTRIKSDNGKMNTKFHDNKIPKKGSHCVCLSVILIDFVFRIGKNYLFLEECKQIFKEKKMTKYIADIIEISSDDFDEENFQLKRLKLDN